MEMTSYHFYHSFKNSSLAILRESLTDTENITGIVLKDIDLYYQPLESPLVSITFFVPKLISVLIGEGIGIKVLATIKKEKGLLTQITKVFLLYQMILHPAQILTDLTINLIYPVNEVIGDWFCALCWFLWGFGTGIVLNNSFMAALIRYFFIIHETKVKTFGKKRAQRIFLVLSIAIPLFQFILQVVDGSPRYSYIKKCYGEDREAFLVETSTLKVLKSKFLKLEKYETNGGIDSIYEMGRRICKVLEATLFVMMGFNITEGVMYYKIFSHMLR
jgi:hypothetical protein